MQENISKIQKLNDQLRQTFIGGQVVITRGVRDCDEATIQKLLYAVQTYQGFTPDNDPYGEHDFGDIMIAGTKFFWKIDYYDLDHQMLSENPADPALTNRVLTVFLASEY